MVFRPPGEEFRLIWLLWNLGMLWIYRGVGGRNPVLPELLKSTC